MPIRNSERELQLEIDARDRAIESLMNQLREAREQILELAPEPFRSMLYAPLDSDVSADGYGWRTEVIDEIIRATRPLPPDQVRGQSRAYCPLCGAGAASVVYGDDGYAIPEGLLRHLSGQGNARSCIVTGALFRLMAERRRHGASRS